MAAYPSSSAAYVVQPGDSLWSIATSHGTSVAALASANRLDPSAILPIGRHLALPGQAYRSAGGAVGEASAHSVPADSFCGSSSGGGGPEGVLPARLEASSDRLALRPLFARWASYYGVSAPLLEALTWQESGWQQSVVSATGAVGVGQIMPGTAVFIQRVLIGTNLDVDSVSDNIRMAAAFLAYLSRVEGGNRCATVAAYYEGPLQLQEYGLYHSTQQYVADVEALEPRFR